MEAIKSWRVTAKEPLERLISVQRHLSLVQFENDEHEISIYHILIICVQHSFPGHVEIRHKNYN